LVFSIPIEGRDPVNKPEAKNGNGNGAFVGAEKLVQLFLSEFEAFTPAFLPLQSELEAGYVSW